MSGKKIFAPLCRGRKREKAVVRTTGLDTEMAKKGMARSGQKARRGAARRDEVLARGSNKNDGIVLTSLLWASFVRMKVQIAEARLRGDIETRGFLPREYLRCATFPLPFSDDTTVSRGATTDSRCVLNFLRSRFPPRARESCSRNSTGCNALPSLTM